MLTENIDAALASVNIKAKEAVELIFAANNIMKTVQEEMGTGERIC